MTVNLPESPPVGAGPGSPSASDGRFSDLPSAPPAAVDREGERRADPELFDRLWADPRTRLVLFHDGKFLAEGDALVLAPVKQATSAETRIFLGSVQGEPRVLMCLSDRAADAVSPLGRWEGLRELAPRLESDGRELAFQAQAIASWHRTHTHCPRCGEPTVVEQGGWSRRCVAEGSEHFPRTDPSVIVAVTDGLDRLLLARNAAWDATRYSLVAGYVDPGEPLELAVAREAAEEVGLTLSDIRYRGSQPWPFPASLMLGFTASSQGEPRPDGREIVDARWFSRPELLDAVGRGSVRLPGSASIARSLIERWLRRELP